MSNWDYLFNSKKYKVKKYKVKLPNNTLAYKFYCESLDISDMLYLKNGNDGYIPFMMNYKVDSNGRATGRKIVKGTIEYDFIRSIQHVMKSVNQKTGKVQYGNLSILQWYFGLYLISDAINYTKNRITMEVVRQFGKTHLMSHIAGFLPVFAPLYADLINDRWWQLITSYTEDSVKEIFDLKTKPIILKNIEVFNLFYPNNKLIYDNYKKQKYVNTNMKLEIRRLINDIAEPYSYIIAISTNKVSDGKSSDWIWSDESWRTDAKEFRRGILPFVGSTGGSLICSGISTIDNNNMQYHIHFNVKDSTKLIANVFTAYNFLLEDYPRRADNIRALAEEEFSSSGIESTESQTNYVLSWDILEGKFYSLDWLRKNNNFSINETLGNFDGKNNVYRVAGLDLATINDYCVLSIFDVYEVNKLNINSKTQEREFKSVYKYVLREVITYNLDKIPMSAEKVAERTAKYCKTYEIDMLMADGTTHQRTHNEWILKKLKELKINTLLNPYDFSGDKNKILLMTNYEQVLKSGLVQFGTEEEISYHTSASILIKEIKELFKGYEKGKRNIQYKAKGRGNTDDHVMSTALGCYCIPYIKYLIKNNKEIEINSYRYKPKLNKFKQKKIQPPNRASVWMSVR